VDATDSEILEGKTLTVEVGGKSYVWREPVRRELRRMLRGLLHIDHMRAGKDENDPELLLDLVDAILDFFYAHNRAMAADQKHLDNCAEDEIADAFQEVAAFLQAPLLEMQKRAAAKMRTQKAASTKS